jgi:hypothetical protein
MGSYSYEIIGGLLIVLSSLVGEEMKRKWKIGFYVFFAVVAFAYSGVGIYLRHQTEIKEAQDRQERRDEIKDIRGDMTKMITLSSGVLPLMESLDSEVAILQRDVEAAREKHDPRAIADLQARANSAQQVSKGVSDRLLVAMIPNAAEQLRARNGGDWNSAEGKEIIANADYLRQVMVHFLRQQTDEDREMTQTFSKALAGDLKNWNPVAAANYLEALRKRLIPGPPTLTVTVQ